MRAGLLTFGVLVATVSAAPHDRRHQHLHAHEKRDPVVATDVVYVTATAPQVVVFVDSDGNPVSTAYNGPSASRPTKHVDQHPGGYGQAAASPAATSTPVENSPPVQISTTQTTATDTPAAYNPPSTSTPETDAPAAYNPPSTSTPSEQPATSSAAPESASASPSAQSGVSGSSSDIPLSGRGVAYTPYNADGTVKTQDEVTSDIAQLDGFSTVRIYDTNNHQVAMLIEATKPKGMKVFAGFNTFDNVASDVQAIIDDAKNDWDSIHSVGVGNEAVTDDASASAAVVALDTARGMLRAAGFTGPVVTVNSFQYMMEHPTICDHSDYPAANIHPYFNSNTDAEGAAAFVQQQVENTSAACGNRTVVVTESGWPWNGNNYGEAVPGVNQQATVISGLKSAFPDNIILFSAFDDSWKAPGDLNCEQYWGFLSHAQG